MIEVGDRLVTIDGKAVLSVKDLSEGNDNEARVFKIAKEKSYHNTHLSLERVERLKSIGFRWAGNSRKPMKSWDERFEHLKQYKEMHGKWPNRREKWEGIGEWIHMQRRSYIRKDPKFMETRGPKLEEIGFPFVLRKFSESISWEDYVEKLSEFHRVNRHFNVPYPEGSSGDDGKKTPDDTFALRFHKWVHVELPTWYRSYKNGTKSRLNEERVNQLLEMGFEFQPCEHVKTDPVPDISFEKRVEQLQQIYEELGHMDIDYRYKKRDNFGGWAAEMSKRYKDWQEGTVMLSSLEEQQFNELSSMGFEFNVLSRKHVKRSWEENYDALLSFSAVYGHAQVPQKYKGDLRLAVWVSKQRQEYKLLCEGKPSKLTQERMEKLENAGFLWKCPKGCRYKKKNTNLVRIDQADD